MPPLSKARSAVAGVRRFLEVSRPVHRDTAAALQRRWEELPDEARSPQQLLGRRTAGCEGTHGVFPRCNLACTPWASRAW